MSEAVYYVDDPSSLAEAAAWARDHDTLGVDTESDSMYAYREKVCFMQIKAGERIYLIDTVALRELGPLIDVLADPGRVKILHGADYDVVCLKRDFGIQLDNLFDTMLAAQFLGKEALGLAALCSEYFGVELDKTLTRHNWGIRPLEDKYLDYLAEDVRHLDGLKRALEAEVEAAGIAEEVAIEFGRVAQLEWQERVFDPEAYRKIKGARDLDRKGRAFLKALFEVREHIAERENLPPFKVINNQAMLALARRRVADMKQLARARSFRARHVKRYGDRIAAALAKAASGRVRLEPARRNDGSRPSPATAAAQDALRRWRREAADERACPTVVVLPNHALQSIARELPATFEDLAETPGLGRNRLQRYGEDILEVVSRHRRGAD